MDTNIEEIWKDVVGYEGYYQVSNLGRIKSIQRTLIKSNGTPQIVPSCILKTSIDKYGYPRAHLSKGFARSTLFIHRLMMIAFFGESKLKVDHINGVKSDNRLSNLRYCSQRMNVFHHYKSKNKYIGSFKNGNKWRALTQFNGKQFNLGTFDTR